MNTYATWEQFEEKYPEAAAKSDNAEKGVPTHYESVAIFPEFEYEGKRIYFSKSLFKAWKSRASGYCQKQFAARYFERTDNKGTLAMQLGNILEYYAIGKNVNDKAPDESDFLTSKGEENADLKRAKRRGAVLRRWIDSNYPEDEYVRTPQFRYAYQNMSGAVDMCVKSLTTGEETIIDIKYTGNVGYNLGWEERGYELNPQHKNYVGKSNIASIDAKMYSMLHRKVHRTTPKFVLLLVNATKAADFNDEDCITPVQMNLTDMQLNRFENEAVGMITDIADLDFCAAPSIPNCAECSFTDCVQRIKRGAFLSVALEY